MHAKWNQPRRVATALALTLACLLPVTAGAAPGDVGTPAAPFSLPVFGGGTHALSQDAGKVVLLFVIGYG